MQGVSSVRSESGFYPFVGLVVAPSVALPRMFYTVIMIVRYITKCCDVLIHSSGRSLQEIVGWWLFGWYGACFTRCSLENLKLCLRATTAHLHDGRHISASIALTPHTRGPQKSEVSARESDRVVGPCFRFLCGGALT